MGKTEFKVQLQRCQKQKLDGVESKCAAPAFGAICIFHWHSVLAQNGS